MKCGAFIVFAIFLFSCDFPSKKKLGICCKIFYQLLTGNEMPWRWRCITVTLFGFNRILINAWKLHPIPQKGKSVSIGQRQRQPRLLDDISHCSLRIVLILIARKMQEGHACWTQALLDNTGHFQCIAIADIKKYSKFSNIQKCKRVTLGGHHRCWTMPDTSNALQWRIFKNIQNIEIFKNARGSRLLGTGVAGQYRTLPMADIQIEMDNNPWIGCRLFD